MYMLNLLTKSLKIIPVTLGTFLLVTSGVTATTTEIKIQKTKINTVSPEEALSVLKNRPQLKVPVSQDNIKQFRDTTFSDNMSQVTNISELQDVSPTDWAYEALRSLVERYGCIVGYPDRTFRGNYSASRNEFAAGLNSCLNTIERLLQENVAVLREDIEKLKRLSQEFEQELIALGARVSNLESRAAFLEDHQFSTTTKLKGEVLFTLSSAAGERALDFREQDLSNQGLLPAERRRIDDNATFGYRTRLFLSTSFSGKDLLRTRIQAGSIPNLKEFTGTEMTRLSHDAQQNGNAVVNKLYYRFPTGNFTTWVGAENLEINDIFDEGNPFLKSSGTGALSRFIRRDPLTMRGPEGIGGGFAFKFNDMFTLRGLYLSKDGNKPSLSNGLFNGNFTAGTQLAFKPIDSVSLNVHFLHSYFTSNDVNISSSTGSYVEKHFRSKSVKNKVGRGIGRDPFLGTPTIRDSYGANGNWRINNTFNLTGWVGYSLARAQGHDSSGVSRRGFGADYWSWMTALSAVDFFKDGAVLSVAGGSLPSSRRIDAIPGDLTVPDQDTPYIVEAQYKYPINDNILLTPGFYVILQPDGNNLNNSIWVGALRTSFLF